MKWTVRVGPQLRLVSPATACMHDRQGLLAEARDKRDLAAFVRRVAAAMSLTVDRDALLAQAAAIEAEADKIQRDAQG